MEAWKHRSMEAKTALAQKQIYKLLSGNAKLKTKKTHQEARKHNNYIEATISRETQKEQKHKLHWKHGSTEARKHNVEEKPRVSMEQGIETQKRRSKNCTGNTEA